MSGTRWWPAGLGMVALVMSVSAAPLDAQRVEGLVFDEEGGGPIAQATVTAEDGTQEVKRAVTDHLGRFTMDLPPGKELVLHASHPEYETSEPLRIDVAEDQVRSVMISLQAIPRTQVSEGARTATDRTAFLYGIVVDDQGRPIPNVEVTVEGPGTRTTSTGANSRFALPEVNPGATSVRFEHLSYATTETEVELAPGMDYEIRARMDVEPLEIEGVEVVARSKTVARRLVPVLQRVDTDHGNAHFFTERDFQRRGHPQVGQLLYGLPSTTVRNSGFRRWSVTFRRRCTPAIYLDGVRVVDGVPDRRPGSEDLSGISEFLTLPTSEVAIVEIYPSPSGLPPEFNDPGTMCAIGIWTRRGGE